MHPRLLLVSCHPHSPLPHRSPLCCPSAVQSQVFPVGYCHTCTCSSYSLLYPFSSSSIQAPPFALLVVFVVTNVSVVSVMKTLFVFHPVVYSPPSTFPPSLLDSIPISLPIVTLHIAACRFRSDVLTVASACTDIMAQAQ